MKLKIDKFCGLASNNTWQKWLYASHVDLYHELVNHIRKGEGCKSNADKMKAVLEKLMESDGQGLFDFLLSEFPDVVVSDPVFPHFDPDLVTIPRRKVFMESRERLDGARKAFMADKHGRFEWVVVGGKGYLEYLPAGYDDSKVPERSWLIPIYKRRKNMI